MPISKALRFEVLRRDGFACTYCGRRPPDIELHIDHVTPSALGGQDIPENLRTACVDCNAGKGSTPPDAELVAQVSDDAERWTAAMQRAADEAVARIQADDGEWFLERWNSWVTKSGAPLPLPANWRQSLAVWQERGLPRPVILEMVSVAMSRRIPNCEMFAYFAGCCWRQLTMLQERASQIVAEVEPE